MRDHDTETRVEKLAWSIEEASQSTGLSKGYFRKIIAAGELKTSKAGRRVLILDLPEWLARNAQDNKA